MRSRIVLDELLTEWRRGGEYPYDTSFPKLHRAWSVATGLVWEMGFRASRVQFEMCGNVNLLAQPVVGVLWHRWCAVAIDLMRHPAFSARPQIWLNLRENKMGPTHVICKRFGVDLVSCWMRFAFFFLFTCWKGADIQSRAKPRERSSRTDCKIASRWLPFHNCDARRTKRCSVQDSKRSADDGVRVVC
jgi:hypothetical protein